MVVEGRKKGRTAPSKPLLIQGFPSTHEQIWYLPAITILFLSLTRLKKQQQQPCISNTIYLQFKQPESSNNQNPFLNPMHWVRSHSGNHSLEALQQSKAFFWTVQNRCSQILFRIFVLFYICPFRSVLISLACLLLTNACTKGSHTLESWEIMGIFLLTEYSSSQNNGVR